MPVLVRADGRKRVFAARAAAPDDGWGEAVTKLIPVEVVAAYLAAVQILSGIELNQSVEIAQWILFAVGMVATVLYMLATWDTDPVIRREELRYAWPQLLIAIGAFAVWAFAVGTPFGLFAWYAEWMGGLALIVGALLLAAINKLLGTWSQ